MEQNNYEYIIHSEYPEIAIIKLTQNVIGGSEALQFSNLLHEVVKKNIKFIIIDMINVMNMNSSGLGMLVGSLSTLKKNNIEMIFINVPEKIYSLLRMTHLNEIFKIFDNLEQAISDIAK